MSDEWYFFNPLAPEMAVDPYPAYHELRRRDPVHQSPLGFWFLSRHADVAAFFADRRLEHQYVRTQTMRLGEGVEFQPYFRMFSHMVFILDDPHHRRVRGLFTSTLALHRNPDQLALLRSDPDLIGNAARELIRYDTPGQATARVSTEPVIFGDVEIPAGQGIVAWIGAANRDPEAFPEPDRLDLQRSFDRDHLSLGGGAHYCLGHALARQELEVALATLLRRCPDLTLETLDPPFRETSLMRGVLTLPVTW